MILSNSLVTKISIPWILLFQLAAILVTVISLQFFSKFEWYQILYAFGFSHYLLALIYSRQQIGDLFANKNHIVYLLILIVIGYALYRDRLDLVYYFGIHHALSEAYLRLRYRDINISGNGLSKLQAASCIYHLGGYLVIVKAQQLVSHPVMLAGLCLVIVPAFIYYVRGVMRYRGSVSAASLINVCGSEVLILLLIPVSFMYRIDFTWVVFYHFSFWALLPFITMPRKTGPHIVISPLLIYVFLSIISLVLFIGASPLFFNPTIFWRFQYYEWFIIFSYLHITLSFAISRANPRWINGLFSSKIITA